MNPVKDLSSLKSNSQRNSETLITEYEYDPSLKPANLNLAILHGKAKRVYKYKPISASTKKCPCCGLSIEGEPLSLCSDLDQLWHVGVGYSVYHRFYKDCIVLMIIMALANAAYSCYLFMNGNTCNTAPNNYCVYDYIGMFMISNIANNPEQLLLHLYFDAGTFVLLLIAFQIIRYRFRKYTLHADESMVTPSDYTIQVNGLTKSRKKKLSNDTELSKFLENFSTPSLPIKVVKICRVYNLDHYIELIEKRDSIQSKIHISVSQNEIAKLEGSKQKIIDKINKLKTKGFKLTRVAFVTFEKAEQAYFFRKKFSMTRCSHHLNKLRYTKSLEMTRAPEPTDINWEYIGQHAYAKLCRRLFIFIITGLLVVICFGIITGLTYLQYKLPFDPTQATDFEVQSYNLGISAVQSIMDPIICTIIALLAQYGGKYSTKTNYFISASQYTTISKFINNVLTLLLGKMIFVDVGGLNNVRKISGLNFQDVYQSTGVVYNMFITLAINAFSQALSNWIGFPMLWKCWIQSRAKSKGKSNSYTQKEAQEAFEGMEYDLEDKYGYLISTFQMQCFFMSSLPIAIVYNIIGLIINYWVDKYILLKRVALPPNLGSKVQEELFSYFELSALLLAMGDAFSYYSIWQVFPNTQNQIEVWILYSMNIIGLLILILPFGKLNEKLFPLNDEPTEQITFHHARKHFVSEYELENPITRRQAIEELLASKENNAASIHQNELLKMNTQQENDIKFRALEEFVNFKGFSAKRYARGVKETLPMQPPTIYQLVSKKYTAANPQSPDEVLKGKRDSKRRSTIIGIELSASLASKFSALPTPDDIEAMTAPKTRGRSSSGTFKPIFSFRGSKEKIQNLPVERDDSPPSTDSEDDDD